MDWSNDLDDEDAEQRKNALAFGGALLLMLLVSWLMSGDSIISIIGAEPVSEPTGPKTVLMVEYMDFRCMASAQAAPTVRRLRQEYGDQLKFELRHFPLAYHTGADKAAQASECARSQGKFWEYHDQLLNLTSLGGDVGVRKIMDMTAQDVGLEMIEYQKCMEYQRFAPFVESHLAEGRSLGIRSTPTFIINGQRVEGALPYKSLKDIVESKMQGISR